MVVTLQGAFRGASRVLHNSASGSKRSSACLLQALDAVTSGWQPLQRSKQPAELQLRLDGTAAECSAASALHGSGGLPHTLAQGGVDEYRGGSAGRARTGALGH